MIGVEPDPAIAVPEYFDEIHPCLFEHAESAPGSVDVAYSSFVLEHVECPKRFWEKLRTCLAPGGVFWGFTVDARHPFAMSSTLMGLARIKDFYLSRLHGRRGVDRYENYPTFYRANSPRRIARDTNGFAEASALSMHRVGQLDYYVPKSMRSLMRTFERISIRLGLPGSILVVRLEKHPREESLPCGACA